MRAHIPSHTEGVEVVTLKESPAQAHVHKALNIHVHILCVSSEQLALNCLFSSPVFVCVCVCVGGGGGGGGKGGHVCVCVCVCPPLPRCLGTRCVCWVAQVV